LEAADFWRVYVESSDMGEKKSGEKKTGRSSFFLAEESRKSCAEQDTRLRLLVIHFI
jgi:hypothetical protein